MFLGDDGMKKWKLALITGMTAVSLAACSGNNDDVVVKLKGNDITQEDFYNQLKDKYGQEVLTSMIQENILKDKYKVTDKEVNEYIEYYKKTAGITTEDAFNSYLTSAGFKSVDDFKTQLKTYLRQTKSVTEGINIKEADIQAQYEKEKNQVSASHILVADEETAKKVKAELDKGGKWDDLVKQYSTDTTTVSNGGSLGFFAKDGSMESAFEEAAFKLKKGEISDPVKTSYGYHIIRIDDTKTIPYEDLKLEIRDQLKLEKAKDYNEVMKKLEKEYKVDIQDKKLKKAIEEAASSSASTSATGTTTTSSN